ncbi:hypothetical protein BDR03DRAFT_397357 [Suillus americanus]|nr:hypothetical protein BDR03DRAFT_397357 [Suillus americanus]
MGCAAKNAKIVAISLGSLQQLITLKAVPQSAVALIVSTKNDVMSQGVDIQLRILQTLVSLITNFPSIHGELLVEGSLVCFKLQDSRIAVVSSTATATLRQLVMFIFEKIVKRATVLRSCLMRCFRTVAPKRWGFVSKMHSLSSKTSVSSQTQTNPIS